jgi:hypothetical protein
LFGQGSFVKAELGVVVIDVHGDDGRLKLVVDTGVEAKILFDRLNFENVFRHGCGFKNSRLNAWYTIYQKRLALKR